MQANWLWQVMAGQGARWWQPMQQLRLTGSLRLTDCWNALLITVTIAFRLNSTRYFVLIPSCSTMGQ